MIYPSLSDYNAAFLSPRKAFADPLLARGKAQVGGFGMPLVLSGGFALTYRLRCPGGKELAVRCFQDEQPGREERYRSLSGWIREERGSSGKMDFWVNAEYQAEGIKVDGERFPIVKMDWASGKTLGAYIEEKHRSAAAMASLRRGMRRLAAYLEERGAAHGDVQNGNVLCSASKLTLIDYDGMFVPGMEALSGCEAGHPNFQHPGRMASHFGPDLDRFSFILYDISLHALLVNPGLYEEHSTGENILFSRADIQRPADSEVFQAVGAEPGMEREVAVFQRICEAPFREVPSLSGYLLGLSAGKVVPVPESRREQAAAADAVEAALESAVRREPPSYAGPYPVYDARDYAGLCAASGRKVEVVGRVEEVKGGLTRNEKPYVFINFGQWREDIFQITIWADGLKNFEDAPDDALAGRWVSVVGLVDQPYTNERLGYTHVGITAHHPSQMRIIGADESAYRLGRRGKPRRTDSPRSAAEQQAASSGVEKALIDNQALIRDWEKKTPQAPRPRSAVGDRTRAPRDFRPPKRFWWFVLRIGAGVLVILLVYMVIGVLLR